MQEKLRECEVLIDSDFFLAAVKTTFMEQARMAIFEVYCRIHQCIDLNMLADRLSMQREEAEKWIANLIRNARLNARCVFFFSICKLLVNLGRLPVMGVATTYAHRSQLSSLLFRS